MTQWTSFILSSDIFDQHSKWRGGGNDQKKEKTWKYLIGRKAKNVEINKAACTNEGEQRKAKSKKKEKNNLIIHDPE